MLASPPTNVRTTRETIRSAGQSGTLATMSPTGWGGGPARTRKAARRLSRAGKPQRNRCRIVQYLTSPDNVCGTRATYLPHAGRCATALLRTFDTPPFLFYALPQHVTGACHSQWSWLGHQVPCYALPPITC